MAKKQPGALTAKASAPRPTKKIENVVKPKRAKKAEKAIAVFRKAVLGGV